MTMYERDAPPRPLVVDEWDEGFGWIAHPDEDARRASHAVRGDDGGVWLLDPLDAPGLERVLGGLGDVEGVVTLSSYHTRDAAEFADRYDVPVYVPDWFDGVASNLDAPIERFSDEVGTSGFTVRQADPFPTWREAVLWRESDATLYTADLLSALPLYRVGDERIAPYLLCRFFPPRDLFDDLEPDRIICGHGTGVFEDATTALDDALTNARRGLPRALFENGPEQVQALWGALRG